MFYCCAENVQHSVNESHNYAFEDRQTRKQVEEIFSKMTLDEKIAQLCGIRSSELVDDNGKLSLEKCREKIPNGIGHLSQFAYSMPKDLTPDELRTFVKDLQQFLVTETPSKIPAILHEEAITGFCAFGATTFPQHIGSACSWNPELIEKKAGYTAQTMRSIGSVLALSPMLDVCKTAHFERMEEGFGEDGYLTARLGLAFVNGLQQGGLAHGVSPTIKHFAGYAGGMSSDKDLYEEILFPFEVAIRLGGVKSVMPGYHQFKETKCIGNKELLTDILRNYLDFDGVIVSDYKAIERLNGTNREDAIQAMNAGADVELPNPNTFLLLREILSEGSISMERFDASVKRALTLKVRLGLLSGEQLVPDKPLDFDPPAHRESAFQLAAQSIVLLKNNGILPLSATKKIALTGPNADAAQSLLGDYTFQSMIGTGKRIANLTTPHLVTLREALQNKTSGSVLYERGCNWFDVPNIKAVKDEDPDRVPVKVQIMRGLPETSTEAALKIIHESDVVIAAMGENLWLTGEGRRRGLRLPDVQEAFLREIAATGKPLILIIFGGRPLVITEFEPYCSAILQAWYPGEEGGNALADILLGNVNPSAKLCMSYPKHDVQQEIAYRYGYDNAGNAPLYPFGFGLSYTAYQYDSLKVTGKTSTSGNRIDVSFTVSNTGKRQGTEIVQLYIVPKDLPEKTIQLKGFKRVELNAGEKQEIRIRLSPQQLAHYSDGEWLIEPGKYEILIGASSQDIRLRTEIVLSGKKVSMEHRNVFFSEIE
jgi:beta-glucosidase